LRQRNPLDLRLADLIDGGLVDDDLVLGRVVGGEDFGERGEPVPVPRAAALAHDVHADDADLPDDEPAARIEHAPVQQKIRRLETLAAAVTRIDAEIGEQAILG